MRWRWASSDDELIELQHDLARAAEQAVVSAPWSMMTGAVIGGCFVAYARGEAGPGHAGDEAWAAAVAWGSAHGGGAVVAESIVRDRVPAPYTPGLLARREGPILAAAIDGLGVRPAVQLVDATGVDHPRGAGLALHLGAVLDVATVGVTHRPLVARGRPPDLRRGASAPLTLDGRCVAYWVCTRPDTRAVVAHAAWRTSPVTAADVVLASSTPAARTPVPLREARRVARDARARG